MSVNLDASFGRVEVTYLTGEGRAVGDKYLEITRQTISDGGDPVHRDNELSPLYLRLSGFQSLSARINVPFPVTTGGRANSRNFSELSFDPNRLLTEGDTGLDTSPSAGIDPATITDLSGTAGVLPFDMDARIQVLPGRTSTVLLHVSSASFPTAGSTVNFDVDTFKALNYNTSGTDPDSVNHLPSRLSDFVRFPLADVPEELRPVVRDESGTEVETASYVYFSGDNYALSDGAGAYFQEVGNVFSESVLGRWSPGTSSGFQGTYDLRDALPTDVTGLTRIVAIYGGFRDYDKVLTGGSTFEVVMFPNSSERYSFEGDGSGGVVGRLGDLLAIQRNASGKIVNMYFGGVDLGENTFELYPIRFLGTDPGDDEAQAERVTGTVSSFLDRNNAGTSDVKAYRRFTFNLPTPPTGVPATGTVTVFRK